MYRKLQAAHDAASLVWGRDQASIPIDSIDETDAAYMESFVCDSDHSCLDAL